MTDETPIECGCVPNYTNIPLGSASVATIELACSHGLSEPLTPAELAGEPDAVLTNAEMVMYAVRLWLGEDMQGEHYKGWLINWGTESEWAIRMTDAGLMIEWNRCPDRERLIDGDTVSWSFHSGLYLHEWALDMMSRDGEADTF